MRQSRLGRRWLGVFVTLLIAAPAIAAVVALAGRRWYPTDDFAIIDLRVRDVFTANTPLTGLYSRPGWNHPGPLIFWAIAPLSWVTGHAPWATRVGGALLQAVALVWLGVATARRGLRWLLAAGLVCSFTFLASDRWLFREPWNLHIPVPFFILFLFLTVFVARGESRQLIGMSIAATVMVSTHLGYAPLVVAGFAYALGWTAVDARRAQRWPSRWGNTLLWCGAIWLVSWSAPLVDVALHWPGNLGKIVRYFVGGGHASVGLGNAARFMADEFRWVPSWLGGSSRLQPFTGFALPAPGAWLIVPVLMVGLAAWLIRRRPDRDQLRYLGLTVVMLVVGIVAISGADEARAYTFQWRAVVAAFLFVACLMPVATTLVRGASRSSSRRWIALAAAIGVIAWGSIAMTVSVVRGPSTFLAQREPDLAAVMRSIDQQPRARGPLRVRSVGRSLPSLYDGVVNELARRGIDVRLDPQKGRIFGSRRTIAADRPVDTWFVTEAGSQVERLMLNPGARLVARVTPLSPADDRELNALQVRIGRALDAAGQSRLRTELDSSLAAFHLSTVPGIAATDLRRLGELNAQVEQGGRCRCAIVVVPKLST